jgi:hypothetical protein
MIEIDEKSLDELVSIVEKDEELFEFLKENVRSEEEVSKWLEENRQELNFKTKFERKFIVSSLALYSTLYFEYQNDDDIN